MKTPSSFGFFDYELRLNAVREHTSSLGRLNGLIDWDFFRAELDRILSARPAKGAGGAPSFDRLLMFKVLVLQHYFNLSDDQTEYQIKDRLSFQDFLGLQGSAKVPDKNTIWDFRERLGSKGVRRLFDHFQDFLVKQNIVAKEGSIVDASFVEAPRQRNSRDENAAIKDGNVPGEWKDNPAKLRQKDTDARWTQKGGQYHYGYKNHVKADRKSKLIRDYAVSAASVHDSQALEYLLSEDDKEIHADSAYRSAEIEKVLQDLGIKSHIHEKGVRHRSLDAEAQARNREKSRTRVRVEHVFGFQKNSMSFRISRYIGLKRTALGVGLKNLVYNLFRYEQILRLERA